MAEGGNTDKTVIPVEGGNTDTTVIPVDNLCLDANGGPTDRKLSDAAPGSLMKNIGKDFHFYMRTNVNIESMTDNIFIRDAYIDIYKKIKEKIEAVGKKDSLMLFHICGTPMIGKTHFLYYVLARLAVDIPSLPGFAVVSKIPTRIGSPVWWNILENVSPDKSGQTTHILKAREPSNISPPTYSRDIRKYKDYIFLIDNAKDDYDLYN